MSDTLQADLIQKQGWTISAAMKKPGLRAHMLKALAPEDFIGPDRELFTILARSGSGHFNPLDFMQAISPEASQRFLAIEGDMRMPDAPAFREWVSELQAASESRAIRRSLKLAHKRLEDNEATETVLGDLMSETQQARERSQGETMISMADGVARTKLIIAKWQAGEEHAETVPTGFADLDAKLGGLERRHITTLGGAPGQGKTQMALQIARNVALRARSLKRESAVVIFSAEMTVERLVLRLASSATGIPARSIRKRTASAQEAEAYMKALDHMAALPIRVDETPSPTTTQMLNRVAMEALTHADGVDLVVFDYLELAGDKNNEKEEARLGAIMRGLKHIAKRFNCPVLVLSQLNREVAKRQTRIPELADLRNSGWIEALSQQVVFIMRPDSYASREKGQLIYENATLKQMAEKYGEGAAFIKIAKNRDEETGLVVMKFNPGSTQFVEKADVKPGSPILPPRPPLPSGSSYAAYAQKEEAA